jgi:hypothetical protein
MDFSEYGLRSSHPQAPPPLPPPPRHARRVARARALNLRGPRGFPIALMARARQHLHRVFSTMGATPFGLSFREDPCNL